MPSSSETMTIPPCDKPIYILSFGGGVNSTALFFYLLKHQFPIDEIIFADTGSELPETYAIVEKFKKVCEEKRILFTIVKSKLSNSLYEYYYDKKALPSRQKRDCTGKFKVSVIKNYLRAKYGKDKKFSQYIGIAAEESHRMKGSNVSYINLVYPLVFAQINREDCIRMCRENGFSEVVKSGCYCCPFTRKEGWKELFKNHPELFEKAIMLEENCNNKKVTLASIPLREIKRKLVLPKEQLLLDDFERTCDVAGSCFL